MMTGITPVTVTFLAKEIPGGLNCQGRHSKHLLPANSIGLTRQVPWNIVLLQRPAIQRIPWWRPPFLAVLLGARYLRRDSFGAHFHRGRSSSHAVPAMRTLSVIVRLVVTVAFI